MDTFDQCFDSVCEFLDGTDDVSAIYPDVDEEETLEWLDADAFPSLDTFEALGGGASLKRRSPVSVLETGVLITRKKPRSKRRPRECVKISIPGGGLPPPPPPPRKRCSHCETDTTPQWRAGPLGPKTLCNACGVRFKSGRLVPEYRPANSPTFSKALHSNSHRKVVEMRRVKYSGQG